MKGIFTLKHLFKLSGKDGQPLGSEEPSIYFDGINAVAASTEATISIECRQEIDHPMLVAIKDLKVALIAAPDLHFRQSEGRLKINGVCVPTVSASEVMPPETAEIIDLDKTVWHPVVRPFRLDGGRLSQLVPSIPANDIRYYLNGLYLDFATGALVAVDGHRLHLVEEAIPVITNLAGFQGVILPTPIVRLLAAVGGVQDVFVMERKAIPCDPLVEDKTNDAKGDKAQQSRSNRVICVRAANAKFRIREVVTDTYPNYRQPYAQYRSLPVSLLLDNRSMADILSVASIAATNQNHPIVTVFGAGHHFTFSHLDRVKRLLPMRCNVGDPLAAQVRGKFLSDAIRSAGLFGTAVRMRLGREQGSAIYVGSQDFHAVVMTCMGEETNDEPSASATDDVQQSVQAPA